MESRGLNKKVSISKPERDALIRDLVNKGIDKDLVASALNSAAEGCTKADNCRNSCKDYYRTTGPDLMTQLKSEMAKKNIDIKKLGVAATKFFG